MKDEGAPVSSYRTFQWITQADVEALRLEKPNVDQLNGTVHIHRIAETDRRIQEFVVTDLERKGYLPSTDGKPDFYVTFYGRSDEHGWISSWEGFTPGITDVPLILFPNFDANQARLQGDGTIYLIFYDGNTKAPVWTGISKDARLDPELQSPEVALAVDHVLAEFATGR